MKIVPRLQCETFNICWQPIINMESNILRHQLISKERTIENNFLAFARTVYMNLQTLRHKMLKYIVFWLQKYRLQCCGYHPESILKFYLFKFYKCNCSALEYNIDYCNVAHFVECCIAQSLTALVLNCILSDVLYWCEVSQCICSTGIDFINFQMKGFHFLIRVLECTSFCLLSR